MCWCNPSIRTPFCKSPGCKLLATTRWLAAPHLDAYLKAGREYFLKIQLSQYPIGWDERDAKV